MTQKPEDAAIEEIILPENLAPLGAVLEEGVTHLDVSMVLAKVFRVQHAEVALLRLDGVPHIIDALCHWWDMCAQKNSATEGE